MALLLSELWLLPLMPVWLLSVLPLCVAELEAPLLVWSDPMVLGEDPELPVDPDPEPPVWANVYAVLSASTNTNSCRDFFIPVSPRVSGEFSNCLFLKTDDRKARKQAGPDRTCYLLYARFAPTVVASPAFPGI